MTEQESSVLVCGVIEVPPGEVPSEAAVVTVKVEEVSRADARSKVVAVQRQRQVPLDPAGTRVPFAVEVPAGLIEKRGSYTVRVHVDTTGSGDVTEGDLVSTQSYPVLTGERGLDNELTVKVRRV